MRRLYLRQVCLQVTQFLRVKHKAINIAEYYARECQRENRRQYKNRSLQ
jgi:hypothetical protein